MSGARITHIFREGKRRGVDAKPLGGYLRRVQATIIATPPRAPQRARGFFFWAASCRRSFKLAKIKWQWLRYVNRKAGVGLPIPQTADAKQNHSAAAGSRLARSSIHLRISSSRQPIERPPSTSL
jgi:hypothetical protein